MYFYNNNPLGYPEKIEKLDVFTLFNVQQDPSEKFNVADQNPLELKEIQSMVENHLATVDSVGTQLEKRIVKQ